MNYLIPYKAVLLVTVLVLPLQVRGLSFQTTPEQLVSPVPQTLDEQKIRSMGCIVASLAVSSWMLYLMGGIEPLAAALTTPISPLRVLEGGGQLVLLSFQAFAILVWLWHQ